MITTELGFQGAYRKLARSLLLRATGFDQCPGDVLDELLADVQIERCVPGHTLIRRGEPTDALLLVLEGALEARLSVDGGRKHLLSFVLPGMTAGYLSLIDRGPQPHDLVVHAPSVVASMPSAARLGRSRPALGQAFQLQMATRLRLVYDALAYSQGISLRERLVRQLITLAEAVGVPRGERWTLGLRLSQTDLAELLGAGRQSINVELKRLEEEGLLQVARSRLDVLDLAGLRALIAVEPPAQA